MSYKKVVKPNREDLREMLLKKNNKQVALDLGVNIRTIQRWRDSYNLDHKSVIVGNHKMTDLQHDIIIGTMLGCASIGYHEPSHNARYTFSSNLDYLNEFIFNQLSPYTIQMAEKLIYTIRCIEFTEMRKIWYKDLFKKKILPDLIINQNHLFFWFMSNGVSNKDKIIFSTFFCDEDNIKLNCLLEKYMNIKGKVYKSKIIFDYNQVIDLIDEKGKEFNLKLKFENCKSTEEELEICKKRENNLPIEEILKDHNISRTTMYRILKKHSKAYPSGIKLKNSDIIEIISLWNEGLSQKMIAENFKVSQTMISQIINRKSRKSITKSIFIRDNKDINKTSAIVSTIYNP